MAIIFQSQIFIAKLQPMEVKGLYDLTFLVGEADIFSAYQSSANNTVTSANELSFANIFPADLGTGKKEGDEIVCITISELTFNTMSRIKCTLYLSMSTITYPTILVIGYDRVYAGTTIRLQTLPTGVTDYCKLRVSLTYYHYRGTNGYMSQSVLLLDHPTASRTLKVITFTLS